VVTLIALALAHAHLDGASLVEFCVGVFLLTLIAVVMVTIWKTKKPCVIVQKQHSGTYEENFGGEGVNFWCDLVVTCPQKEMVRFVNVYLRNGRAGRKRVFKSGTGDLKAGSRTVLTLGGATDSLSGDARMSAHVWDFPKKEWLRTVTAKIVLVDQLNRKHVGKVTFGPIV